MDIKDIREKKKEAEKEIYHKLKILEMETGARISGVDLISYHLQMVDDPLGEDKHCHFTIKMEI